MLRLLESREETRERFVHYEDDFIKNAVTMLAEVREVLAIYHTRAFLKGTVPA